MLLQLYFAIGIESDVLPHEIIWITDKICVKNCQKIVLTAISSILDFYFTIRMSPVTDDNLKLLEFKIKKMSSHYIELFQCKLKFLGITDVFLPPKRKLHSVYVVLFHLCRISVALTKQILLAMNLFIDL